MGSGTSLAINTVPVAVSGGYSFSGISGGNVQACAFVDLS
jgi:hypothetical protein